MKNKLTNEKKQAKENKTVLVFRTGTPKKGEKKIFLIINK